MPLSLETGSSHNSGQILFKSGTAFLKAGKAGTGKGGYCRYWRAQQVPVRSSKAANCCTRLDLLRLDLLCPSLPAPAVPALTGTCCIRLFFTRAATQSNLLVAVVQSE